MGLVCVCCSETTVAPPKLSESGFIPETDFIRFSEVPSIDYKALGQQSDEMFRLEDEIGGLQKITQAKNDFDEIEEDDKG